MSSARDEEEGNCSDCVNGTCPQDIIILLDAEFMQFLEPHAQNYQELNPHIRITLQQVEGGAAALQQQLMDGSTSNEDNNNNNNNNNEQTSPPSVPWDGAIFPAQNVGVFVEANILWDMSSFVRTSETVDWPNLLPFFRHDMATYGNNNNNNKVRMIPLDGDVLTMFYRRDLFQEHNIPIPRTWGEYIDAAKYFHGKPLGGRHGSLITGSCVSRAPNCANEYWTNMILSTMTQTRGTSSGFFLDPHTLDPLFGDAMDAALEVLAEQYKVGDHEGELQGGCLESNYAFNEGHCALTYNWGSQLALLSPSVGIDSSEFDIGVAPTPGSIAVLDRATNTLEKCTEETCPHGVYYDDIGIVNYAPYSAFGGWAGGVSNASTEGKQHAAAEFFAYVSNSQQSLGDVLPNGRSLFAQPYRYPHVTSSNWIDGAGFEEELAWQFTQSVRGISSENSVLEMRMPLSSTFRSILDEEVTDYLDRLDLTNTSGADNNNSALRQEVTARLDQRIRNVIAGAEDTLAVPFVESYQRSIGYTEDNTSNMDNLIDEDFRNAAWGLTGLICLTTIALMVWILRYRNNRVMKAFQPFLLMQSAVGLFLLAATVIPLGFDDSLFSVDVLNITCMLIPWMYVTGFTIFFSSVYCKIRKCVSIYREPSKHDVLIVSPSSAVRLNTRLLLMNGVVLIVWTLVDPLTWVRTEVEGGIVLEDGSVETYGVCMGSGWGSLTFALILFFMNLLICCIATFQAFACRFLVLEYNEMQWLPLSLFPFIQVWLIGVPIVALSYDYPTLLFVVLSGMITASTISVGLAVFAPKDWYIRKYRISKQGNNKQVLERDSSAGILVLKHPTVESQKQLEELQSQFEQIHSYNTELEIEIRTMKDKFRVLTATQKFAVAQGLFGVSDTGSREHRGVEEFEQTEISKANDRELEAMEQFEQVWKMPDEEYDDEHEVTNSAPPVVPVPVPIPTAMHDSMSSFDHDGDGDRTSLAAVGAADKECAPGTSFNSANKNRSRGGRNAAATGEKTKNRSRSASTSQDAETSMDTTLGSVGRNGTSTRGGMLPSSPESNGLSIYEDQDSRDMQSTPSRSRDVQSTPSRSVAARSTTTKAAPPSPMAEDPSRIEWFLNNCDSSEEESEDDPEKILEITKRALASATPVDDNDRMGRQGGSSKSNRDEEDERATRTNRALTDNHMYNHDPNIDVASHHDDFQEDEEDESESDGSDALFKKKDAKDLRSMIKDDDLAALEARASILAESLKTKLMDSHLADLTGDSYSADESKSKDSRQNFTDLDISKIASEDGDTTRDFVVMSDSILAESPARNVTNRRDYSGDSLLAPQIRDGSSDSDSKRSGPTARAPSGESSAANVTIPGGVDLSSGSSPTGSLGYATQQNAGEPSQGDRRGMNGSPQKQDYSYFGDDDSRSFPDVPPGEVGYDFRGLSPSKNKPATPKTLKFKTDDSHGGRGVSTTDTSYSLADWSAVGNTASLLQDWSDSQSNSSFADSYAESTSSLEATTRASALDTPLANEIDNLVASLDWDGVKMAAKNIETSIIQDTSHLSIQDKRRKKRELEAWRSSISRSYSSSKSPNH